MRALQPAGKVPRNASLATVVMQGGLSNVCQARDKCSDGVRWQLGGWSPCSTSCGGGYKRRSATCVSFTGGCALCAAMVCCHSISYDMHFNYAVTPVAEHI